MRQYELLIVVLLFYCCVSCTHDASRAIDADFIMVEKLQTKDSINLEELGLLLPFTVTSFDSCFIFGNIRSEYFVSVLDKQTHTIHNIVNNGNGPGEVILFSLVRNNEDRFLFADVARNNLFELEFKKDFSHNKIFQINDSLINKFCSIATIDDSYIIGTGMFGESRFVIYNLIDRTFSYSGKYPNEGGVETLSSIQKAALFSGTFIAIHPNKSKFISADSGIIEFYDVDKNYKLVLNSFKYYHFPQFSIPNNGPVIATKKESITGFIGMTYNSTYVYLLYSNSTYLERGADTFSSNVILVFDWDGKPIKEIILSNEVRSIDVDADTIWGVSSDHSKLYKYVL